MKASLIVLLGVLVSGLMRRRAAASRHRVLAWTLACAAILPAFELVAPPWHPPHSLAWMAPSLTESRLDFGDDPAGGRRGRQPGVSATGAHAASGWRLSPFQRIWLGGSLLSFLFLALGLARVTHVVRRAKPLREGPWTRALDDVAGEGRRPAVRVVTGRHTALLFTWGVWRPTIVIPAGASTWPAGRIRAVLGHELAHVRRRDWAVHMLAQLLRCAYWFNPLVWIACRRLREAGEQACDDAVLNAGMPAPDYAAHLVEVAQLFKRTGHAFVLPVVAIVGRSGFERRVTAMLTPGVDRSPRSGVIGLATVSVLVLLTVSLAGLSAAPPSPSTRAVVAGGMPATPTSGAVAGPQSSAAVQTAVAGTIKDPAGRVMPDVVVDVTPITSPDGPKPQVRTGPDGRFEVKGLPPGDYDISSSRRGFKMNILRVALKPDAPLTLAIALQIGSLSETITVQGDWNAGVSAAKPASVRVSPSAATRVGPDPCDTSAVGGCLTPPLKLVDVKPVYPQALAQRGVSGTVVVKAVLGVEGRLRNLEPEAGPDTEFVSAVLDAVRQWEFTSVRLNGVPQECQVTVTVRFVVE